jgi:hypothetical protein
MDAGKFIDDTYKRDWDYFAEMCCRDLKCKECGYNIPVAIEYHSTDQEVEVIAFAELWEQNPAFTDLNKIYRAMRESKQLCASCHSVEHAEKMGIEPYRWMED